MKNLRKAFTIVELVIVIAVIAILAAVLIPTFSNIVDKANDSSALQNGRNMYMEYISTEDNYSKANENFVIEVKENEAYVTFKDGQIVDEVFSTKEAAINSLGAGASYIVVNEELLGTEEHEHVEEIIPAVEATCTTTGLTEGKKCSVCNEVLVAQTEVAALGHSYTDGKCTVCQADDPEHVHTEEVLSAVPATCTATGLTEGKKCSVCKEVLVAQTEVAALGHSEEVIPGKDATCTATGLTEGKKCSVCKEVLVAQVEIPSGHNYVDGKCNVCNELKPSEGLVYTLNADGISYSVSINKETCTDTNVVIAKTIDGKPVTTIGQWAFTWTNFSTITIPNSITEIGYGAFQNSDVTEIIFETGSQLKSIGGCGFYSCKNLKSIVIPNSVISIGIEAFINCTNLTIYCEVTEAEKPNGWVDSWNYSNCPVIWGYTGE